MASLTPDQKLVQEYEGKFKACASARKKYEQEWYTNLAFYFGKHYVEWTRSTTGTGNNLIIPKAPAWRVRLVINRVKPIIRKEFAKLNQEKPRFYAIPPSPDDDDIAAARAADAIAEHIIYGNAFASKRRLASWWSVITGTGFIKTTASEDIDFDCPTPFHLWFPNLENPFLQEQPFVIHGIAMSPEEVKAKFGADIEPDTVGEASEIKFLQAMGLQRKEKELQDVFLKEFWIKPNAKFPDGAMFITGNEKLIYMEEGIPELEIDPVTNEPVVDPETNEGIPKKRNPSNVLGGDAPTSKFPYKHGRYPFSKIEHIPTGKFYGESVLVDLIPIQKEYNRSRSQGVEARNLTAKPQYVVPKGSIDVSKLVAMPGLVIEYTPGFDKPEPMRNPELPAHFHQDQAQSLNDIDYISNQYEVSQGRTPPGIEAASAIAYLQEESDAILSPTIDSLEEAVEDAGYQALMLAKEFWPEDKIVRVISGNQVYETITFKRDTLPDELTFKVEKGSMAPVSRAGKRAFIMELIQNGLVPPMEGLKYLEMSQVSKLYDELQVDVRQVERENFKMKNGLPVPTNDFDNNEVHAIKHAQFMKSQIFEGLPDEIKGIFLEHYNTHLIKLGRMEDNAGAIGPGQPQPGSDSGIPAA